MKEYIEREALNKVIDYEIEVCNSGIAKGVLEMLKVRVEPAADVVEVVRCKDCKYCIPATADGAEYELCIVDDDVFPVSVQKQHFCGRGKRKEG